MCNEIHVLRCDVSHMQCLTHDGTDSFRDITIIYHRLLRFEVFIAVVLMCHDTVRSGTLFLELRYIVLSSG